MYVISGKQNLLAYPHTSAAARPYHFGATGLDYCFYTFAAPVCIILVPLRISAN